MSARPNPVSWIAVAIAKRLDVHLDIIVEVANHSERCSAAVNLVPFLKWLVIGVTAILNTYQ